MILIDWWPFSHFLGGSLMMKSTNMTVYSYWMFQKALKSGEGQRSKWALSYAYAFNVHWQHCYVGHLRRVHSSNLATEVEVTSISGTKTKTMVKAFDPLAENGSLYCYHSKTKMYDEWFFWIWYEVLVPTYQNVLLMLYITLWKSWSPSWTVKSPCKFSVILSNIVKYCAILSSIFPFLAHQSTEEKHLSHWCLISSSTPSTWHTGFCLSPKGLKSRRQGKGPLLRSSRQLLLPSRTKCWKSTCGPKHAANSRRPWVLTSRSISFNLLLVCLSTLPR